MRNIVTTLIITLIGVLSATEVEAQQDDTFAPPSVEVILPDEDDILDKTLATSSPYYYTNLMLKYRNGTEPLSDMEYYYLYYGYAYQEGYRPFVKNNALDDMLTVMASINPERPTVGQLERVIEYGIEAMELDPFNPKVLNIMAFAYGALDDPERERLYYDHLNGILRAIESSGTGLKEESPWHVLMFSHAYDVVAAKGYAYNEARIISRTTEFVPLVRKTGNKIKGFYFDYSRVYRNKPDDVVLKRDRTWQFNNLAPREYK
ncbi:MAG: DUF4919 domain-containing protein [Rikenellaceae bacterium]|nr:DUF4919 domain-containing protein [Rikenellaceae bacterium]